MACLFVVSALSASTAVARSPRDVSIVGGQWTWASGSDRGPFWELYGTYGTRGVAAPGNRAGVRHGSVSWSDASGNFWLFGGYGAATSDGGFLNDLWKWDGTNWTWMSGSDVPNQNGVYGTKGAAASGNVPGARRYSVSWTDLDGNLWLFGGDGYAASRNGYLNDLWKWDGTSWTWVSGSDAAYQGGTYGTKGVRRARERARGVVRERFRGRTRAGTSGSSEAMAAQRPECGDLNDLWKWDGTNWTWVAGPDAPNQPGTYGTKGVAAPGNAPRARAGSVAWRDATGNLWLFGGDFAEGTATVYLNDLWKWDGATWTWVSGSDTPNQLGTYGTKGVSAPGNVPGARSSSVAWRDPSGNLWLFGGSGYSSAHRGRLNDLWKWDGASWTWISGSHDIEAWGRYGTKGVAEPGNEPGARSKSVSWSDPSGSLWLFGGEYVYSSRNDLWKWDGANWTWVSGSNGQAEGGSYGTKGVAVPGNVPGRRYRSASWVDSGGNFWLFGGQGWAASVYGELNDLWKWDGTNWTWVSGSDAPGQSGTYGTKGVAAPANVPGARESSVSWRDASGSLWLFGGVSPATFAGEEPDDQFNDLWRWDGMNWTWVSGSKQLNQHGTYGTKGVAAPGNVPGARFDSVSWSDASGNLWLFGGCGYAATTEGALNDLWKWDGTYWTWMSGSDAADQPGIYGTKGLGAPANVPGARCGAVSWTDASGDFWLFGGSEPDAWRWGNLNDLWKWDGSDWTWMTGSDEANQYGTYGTKGVAAPSNVPGARSYSVSWTDASGNLWLFGGAGRSATADGALNDLWKWDGTSWTWVSGSNAADQPGVSGSMGVSAPGNVPGARYGAVSWTDASGNLWLFGPGGNALWVFGTQCSGIEPPTAGNGGPYGTGATIHLTASTIAGATYYWTGPNGFASTEQNPTIPGATTAMEGTYSVTATVGACASWSSTNVAVLGPKTLSVTKTGSGSGSVTSSAPGIDCGGTCSATFPGMSSVTLTATADAGSHFAGWSGACSGFEACHLSMTSDLTVTAAFDAGEGTPTWLLPSSAHASGVDAFWTTDLVLTNSGTETASVGIKFLGHEGNGASGPERLYSIPARATRTIPDVLSTAFGRTKDWGPILVRSSVSTLSVQGQTWAASPTGGTYGQSVPALGQAEMIGATPKGIAGVRQDGAFRTNLVLANASDAPATVDVALLLPDGSTSASQSVQLGAYGFSQLNVLDDLGVSAIAGGSFLLTCTTPDSRVAAYASVIDAVTADPRTILMTRDGSAAAAFDADARTPGAWLLPSSARTSGVNAFWTTDLVLMNTSLEAASVNIKFLGHQGTGASGPEQAYSIPARATLTIPDVLSTVFGRTKDWGPILIRSSVTTMAAQGQTWTASPSGGTYGQSVPALAASEAVGARPMALAGVRQDDRFRTNIVLANLKETEAVVTLQVLLADGSTATNHIVTVGPLGFVQLNLADHLGVTSFAGGSVLVSSSTAGAQVAAYASVIDAATADPRTVLAR